MRMKKSINTVMTWISAKRKVMLRVVCKTSKPSATRGVTSYYYFSQSVEVGASNEGERTSKAALICLLYGMPIVVAGSSIWLGWGRLVHFAQEENKVQRQQQHNFLGAR